MSQAQNQSCAEILAVSVRNSCPFLIPIQASLYEGGFCYDFVATSRCDEAILPLITQEMRRVIAQNITIERLTMMPQNAQSFLQGSQPIQASLLEQWDRNLVELCKINGFIDICLEETLASTGEIQEFALTELQLREAEYDFLGKVQIARIYGIVDVEKKALKRRLKQIELAKRQDPVVLAKMQELLLVQEGEVVWLPKGMQLYTLLQEALDLPYQLVSGLRFKNLLLQQGAPYRFAEFVEVEEERLCQEIDGLFATKNSKRLHFNVFCQQAELESELISSLQFMQKMVRILGLEGSFVAFHKKGQFEQLFEEIASKLAISFERKKGGQFPRIELVGHDLRGRSWSLGFVEWEKKELVEVRGELCSSYERVVALLLEKEASLPFSLVPEQVRILPVGPLCVAKANELAKRFREAKIRAFVERSDAPLATKVYIASQQKIPVAIVIGERELKNSVLNVRLLGSTSSREMSEQECLDAIYNLTRELEIA